MPDASQSIGQFDDRTRFNWGFHDGTLEASWGDSRIRCVNHHADRSYAEGYKRGVAAYQATRIRPSTSDVAWAEFQTAIQTKEVNVENHCSD